jgi:PAS domain S-box-containing protein
MNLEPAVLPPLTTVLETRPASESEPCVWIHQSGLPQVSGKLLDLALPALLAFLLAVVLSAEAPWLRAAAAVGFLLVAYLMWDVQGKVLLPRKVLGQSDKIKELLAERVRVRTADLTMAYEAVKDQMLERQWANQALEHQLRYSQLIINAISDPIFVLTKTLKITRLNPAALHLIGYNQPELVGGPLSRVLRVSFNGQEEILMKTDPLTAALKENRELHERSAFLLSKNGKILPATLRMFPLRDHDKVVGGVVVARLAPKTDSKPTA